MENSAAVNIDTLIDKLHRYWNEVQGVYAALPREFADAKIRELRKTHGVKQSSFTYGVALEKPVLLEITCRILIRRTKKRVMIGPFKLHKKRSEISFLCDGDTDEKLNSCMRNTGMRCSIDIGQIYKKRLSRKTDDMDGRLGVVRGMANVSESEGGGECRVNITFIDLPEITPRASY